MAVIIPVAIVGSFFTIISQFPVDSWKKFITPYLPALQVPVTFSIGMMALYSCYAMAAALAEHYKLDRNSSATVATMAFFILAVSPGTLTAKAAKLSGMVAGTVLPSTNFGAQGLFTAMVVSMVSVEIIRWFKEKNLVIKMPDGVPPAVSNSFVSLIPASVIILIAWIIKELLHFDLNAGLLALLSPLSNFGKDNFISAIVPPFFNSLFWLFGIHGAITSTPIYPYWYKNLDANMVAIAHGVSAANAPRFMTEQFFQWFVYIGGSGTILGLCILLAFASKSSFGKTLGKAVIIPSIFNINEPIIFGLPIVLNPYFAIPFIITPMITGALTYFATVLHLVSRTIALVPWTLPGPIGAYMATGFDWRAAVLSLINIVISIVIYYPFFKVWDKKQLEKEAKNATTTQTSDNASTNAETISFNDKESKSVVENTTFAKKLSIKNLFHPIRQTE
ncbi:cellobiose-specific PTS system IIC component [Lactobacillus hominis DSM 23910 = CRBIP 24.179]|nr:cellobiose-specific PTS system IIC component [Lactobacillus hominis DSM 23910 = CRBIP 24.179]